MSVEKEKLSLSVADSSGQVRILASARVKLCTADSLPTLLVCKPDPEANSDTVVSI